MKALVVCDCGACHSKQRFVTMRTRSRHRKIFKRIVAPPTLPEEAPEDDDDDDEQFSDGDNDGEESDDHGEEFDKQVCNPGRMSILPFRHYLIFGS